MKRSAAQPVRRRLVRGVLFVMLALLAGAPGPSRAQGLREVGPTPDGPAVRVVLDEPLTSRALRRVQDALGRAEQLDAALVVLELDLDAGELGPTEQLARLLRRLDRPVIAYVRGDAVGPGAWIALAADEIVMGRGGKIGDASVEAFGERLSEYARTRRLNELRTEFRLLAELHDRPAALAEAMVDPDLAVWRVRPRGGGEAAYVRAGAPGVEGAPGQADSPAAQWLYLSTVVETGRTLLATPREALELGLAEAVVDNLAGLAVHYRLPELPESLDDAPVPATPAAQAATAPAEPREDAPGNRANLPDTVQTAYVIPINDQRVISGALADGIRRKVVQIKAQGGKLVIFDFNTPGGEVAAALEISGLIRRELDDIHTVAYVNPEAISAGALLSLACDEIVMAPGGKIGDAAPILMGGTLEGVEREKIETYLRSEFRGSAQANNYPVALAEAMVSADIEVWLVENTRTGEQQYVKREDWSGRVRTGSAATTAPSNPDADWELIRVVVPAGQLLTMTTAEAVEYGFVAAVVPTWEGLTERYNVTGEFVVLEDTWSETLADFLTSPAISSLLVLGLLVLGYMEMNTPGFGVFGVLALVCLGLLLGSRYLTGLAQWWEIAIIVLGLVLLAVEIFVIPGFGVAGIAGLLLIVAGMLAVGVANAPDKLPIPEVGLEMDMFLDWLFVLGVSLVLGVVLMALLAKVLPKAPLTHRLILAPVHGHSVAVEESREDQPPLARIRVGDVGVIEAPCRPTGRARFAGELIEVVAAGDFLPAGTEVVALSREGNRLRVKRSEKA